MYSILVEKIAQQELLAHYKAGNKTTIKKIEQIFSELSINPQTGTGKPEKLKFNLAGY